MRPDQTSRFLQWMTEKEDKENEEGRYRQTRGVMEWCALCVCVHVFLWLLHHLLLCYYEHETTTEAPTIYSRVWQKANICCLIVVVNHGAVQRFSLARPLNLVQNQRKNAIQTFGNNGIFVHVYKEFKFPTFSLIYYELSVRFITTSKATNKKQPLCQTLSEAPDNWERNSKYTT